MILITQKDIKMVGHQIKDQIDTQVWDQIKRFGTKVFVPVIEQNWRPVFDRVCNQFRRQIYDNNNKKRY